MHPGRQVKVGDDNGQQERRRKRDEKRKEEEEDEHDTSLASLLFRFHLLSVPRLFKRAVSCLSDALREVGCGVIHPLILSQL